MATYTDAYDRLFQEAAPQFFPYISIEGLPFDWRLLKAQAIAESGLDPRALSPCGALGLMQLMPGTAKECARELRVENDPWNPEINVLMGAHYLRRMWNVFRAEQGWERLRFAWAAYNAGVGHIICAQKEARRRKRATDRWESIAPCLKSCTGRHAAETLGYVARIERLYVMLSEAKHLQPVAGDSSAAPRNDRKGTLKEC